ncbi:AMP-binding protein [Massilia niabensis]|uniref:AMP-binding protein n=1 Tax=Massilia niabensis TaxID=544910 RepID=A0ABW0LF72_9BURK
MDVTEYRRDAGGWLVRWNPVLAEKAVREGDWTNKTIAEYARDRVAAHPEQVLIVEGERTITARTLYEKAQRLAGWFIRQGLQPGDVVSFQLPNWWEAAVIDLAACMTGVVVNPIVTINRDTEVTYMLNESGTKIMFVPEAFRKFDYAEMMRRIAPALTAAPRVVVLRGSFGTQLVFDDIIAAEAPLETLVEVDPNAVKLLMYTSGTTGRPKGVLHSHNSILADCVKMKPVMQLKEPDHVFCPSPLTHVTGYLWILTMPWYGGLTAVTIDTWDPKRAFELLKRYQCALMLGATPFLQDLLGVVRDRGETLPALRYYLCGGAAVPPSLIYEAAECFSNCIPWRNFGATEATTMTAPPRSRADVRYGAETDGRLHHAEVKILDVGTGLPSLPGAEGEILVREPSMALGYARREDNEGNYDDEGYFRMGDLGHLLENEYVVCTGRRKDLIIRSGENISAKEIEDVLLRSPLIREAAVVSMPSRKTGEAICAFLVPDTDASFGMAEVSSMIQSAGLAKQKTPEHVQLVAALPKTASGKVRKDVLREIAKDYSPT